MPFDVALLKLETENTANSKILIIVAEGNDVGSVTKVFSNQEAGAVCSCAIFCLSSGRS